jgi:phosphatidylserine/phosphatidylglycerophosphate/cardiolipin synthase-like enzyme
MIERSRIDIGPQTMPGLYFLPVRSALPAWVGPPALGPKPWDEENARYLFTDDVGQQPYLRQALVEMIGQARRKVFFCSYLFADRDIVEALAKAAERLRGGVYVLTALDKSLTPDLSDLEEEPDERARKQQLRQERHMENLGRLAEAGVWLRGGRDCHAKFCVIDDEVALVTSANATEEAYTRNPENGIRVHAAGLARELGRLFAAAWLYQAHTESAPGFKLDVRDLTPRSQVPWHPLVVEHGPRAVATLGRVEHSLRERTLALIDGAREELAIASYSAVGLRQHAVGAALRRAVERGVRLLLVLRERNGNEDQRDTCAWLIEQSRPGQVCLRGHRFTHAKVMVADGERTLLWTGNLDGHHGYDDGLEVGIELAHFRFARGVREYVAWLAAQAGHEGVVRPTLAQLAATGGPVLSGEWTLRIPSKVRDVPSDLAEQLAREQVGYFRAERGWVLRVGRHLHLQLREDAGIWNLEEVIKGGPLGALPLTGLVANCSLVLEVEARSQVEGPRRAKPRQQVGQQRRRRGRRK